MNTVNWGDFTPVDSDAAVDAGPADWSQFEEIKPAEPGFIPTIKRTAGQMLTTAATTAEDVTGPNAVTKAVQETGQGIIDRNPAGIKSLRDLVDSPWLAVKESVGQFAPQIGAAAAGGLAGARAGGAIAGPAGAVAGGAVGSLLPIFTQEYGGIRQEQQESGQEDKGRALAAAIPATALERVGMGNALKVLKGSPVGAGSILKEAGKGVLKEGATEGAQNVIEQWGAFKDPTTGESLEDTALAAVMGGIGGGAMGGAAGAVDLSRQRAKQGGAAAPGAADPSVAGVAAVDDSGPDSQTLYADARGNVGPAPNEAPAAPVIDPTAGPLSKAASKVGNLALAPEQLSADEVRAFNNAYRRDVPDPLDELQQSVRAETAYTTPADAQGVSQSVEDAWLQANVLDEAPEAVDAAAVPVGEPDAFVAQAIAQTDAKVRDGRILSAVQNLVNEPVNSTAAALQSLDASLARVGEPVLSGQERVRVQRLMGAHAAFTGRTEVTPLPSFLESPVDAGADNAALEALIPEREPTTTMRPVSAARAAAQVQRAWPRQEDVPAAPAPVAPAPATRPSTWRSNAIAANTVARDLGLAPKGKQLAQVVGEIDAADALRAGRPHTTADMAAGQIDGEWSAFAADTGTLGVPRAQMPQIKAEHRGALVNFLKARGIDSRSEELPAADLLPTQAEFSPARVERARQRTGGDRSILISSDGYVVDGHHQWLAKRADAQPVSVIRLGAPIREVLGQVAEFPSVASSSGATAPAGSASGIGLSTGDHIDQLEAQAAEADARAADWTSREYKPNNKPLPKYEAVGGPVDVQEANEQRRLKEVVKAKTTAANARAEAETLRQQGNAQAQEAAKAGRAGLTVGEQRARVIAQHGAAARAQLLEASQRWTLMTTVERQALAQRATDLNAVAKKNVHARAWADLGGKVRGQLADAMQPLKGAAAATNAAGARETGPDMALFSARGAAPEDGLSLEQAQQAVQQALAGLRTPPPVDVVTRSAELGVDAPDGVMGAARPGEGRIVIVASAHRSADAVVETLFHEMFHLGVRNVLPDADYVQTMLDLAKRDARVRQYAIDWKKDAPDAPMQLQVLRDLGYRGSDLTARYEALSIEEGLAVVAEELKAQKQAGTKLGVRVRVLANWLASVADRMGMTRLADSIRKMTYNEAERFVMRAIDSAGEGRAAGAASGHAGLSRFRTRDGTPVAQRVGDAIKAATVTNLTEQAGFKATDYMPLGLQFLGRRQLVDVYGEMLPQLSTYSDLMARMDADKNEAGAGADELATAWGKLPDERQLAELMHDATLAQIDPAKDFVAGDNKTDWMRLQAQYQALSPAARDVYTRTRDTYSKHMQDVRSAIKERIERSEMGGQRKAEMLKRMDDEFFGHTKGVYFPLSRFGQYVVVVKDAEGKTVNVSRAETMGEANATRLQLQTPFPASKGFTVGKVLKAKEFVADRDAVGRGFMEQLYGVLDKQGMDSQQRAELEYALGQLYLSALPDLSWAKHGIHRKGTPGFSQDARRAFAQNVFHGASYLAKLRYSDQLQDQLSEMDKHVSMRNSVAGYDSVRARQVLDEMNKRHESAMNPKSNSLSTKLTSLGFIYFLGLSPASAMVNLTQTALVAYPVMGARWGYGKASAALMKASQEAVRGKNDITTALNADEKAAFDEAVRSGVIDVTMAHDLAGVAQGEDMGVMWKLRPIMKWASFLFHHAEKFNRQITFVAAYRLARETGAESTKAYADAVQATYDGHFDYSANNRPRVMQGNAARVLLLFKQYSQNMVYTLTRSAQQSLKGATPQERAEARKVLGGLLVMHGLAAGALGLPMVTTLLAAASMLGGDDDEPWDAQIALQNMLADTFGQKPAEVLAHGLSRLTPWDVSGRIGLDRLIFPDIQEGLEGQRLGESAMAAALGPVAGIAINALKGLQDMGEGRYLRGLEGMMPTALRAPLKAWRYGTEGVLDKSGIVVQDEVDAAALLGQGAGFSPSSVRNSFAGKSAIVQHDRALQARRSTLVEQFAMAAMAGDEEGKADVRADIAKFNEKNPGRRIQPMQLAQSVRMRTKRIEQAQDGVYLPAKRRDAMDAGRFAAGQ